MAFDTISHDLLLQDLENISFQGKVYDLFKSYLSDRQHGTNINSSVSKLMITNFGVPQRTIMSPKLFNIYMNDLFLVDTDAEIIAYAEGTALFYQGIKWEQIRRMVEKDINKIKDGFDYTLLTVNMSKTYFMPICNNVTELLPYNSVILNNYQKITMVKEYKYLGVIMNCDLTWNTHFDYIVKKLDY